MWHVKKITQLFLIIQADRAYGMEISPRSFLTFLISFVILLYAISYNIYLTICHYVSCRLKEIADASMQAVKSHC
jgi:hypothetical protein